METITKKELLAQTGISYGQLYRWKRQKLIPEDWFIKQASYTGQETIFPREQILSRIQAILDAKDTYSLDELASLLSPEQSETALPACTLSQIQLISKEVLQQILETRPKAEYHFFELVLFAAVSAACTQCNLKGPEIQDLLQKSWNAARENQSVNRTLLVLRVGEELHTALLGKDSTIHFDSGVEIIYCSALGELADQLKLNYQSLFVKEEQK